MRVAVVLKSDVVDGNTGDVLWAEGTRLSVDPKSAKAYLRSGEAVLAEDDVVDEPPLAEFVEQQPVSAEAQAQLDRLEQQLAEEREAEAAAKVAAAEAAAAADDSGDQVIEPGAGSASGDEPDPS